MDFRFFCQLPVLLGFAWRGALLVVCLGLALRMSFAEVEFTRAVVLSSSTKAEMAAAQAVGQPQQALNIYLAAVERSLDGLAAAGVMYPYSYRLRTGQADELYRLVPYFPALAPAAETALGYALAVDSRSVPLIAGRVRLLQKMGRCDEAKVAAERLLALAPRSERAQNVASASCGSN